MTKKNRVKRGKEVIYLNVKNCLIAAVLSAIVLALVFIPLSGSQTAMPYDPWADINDDGTIDGKDVSYTARLFGTTGDPTKNVSVSGYGFKVLSYRFSIPAEEGGCLNISTADYKSVTFHFNPIGCFAYIGGVIWQGHNVSVAIGFDVGGTYELLDEFNTNIGKNVPVNDPEWFMETPAILVRTYTIRGEKLIIGYFNPTNTERWLDITIFLTA
jgi:hypothetical protein